MSRFFIITIGVCLGAWLWPGSSAEAQYRADSERSRMEVSFDHGYGFGTEGQFLELALDLRLFAPAGVGVALRGGLATQGLANAFAVDLGFAVRGDWPLSDLLGVSMAATVGPSLASGPFDGGNVVALGGWSLVNLDLWFRGLFVGVGASAHVLWSERHAQQADPRSIDVAPRDTPVMTLTPMIRFGGEWGL